MRPPTEEELSDLYRLLGREGSDLRAHGAVTLGDVAEASGISVAEVQAALERLRAEKSFSKAPPRLKRQWPMAALAASLFLVAGVIYKTTPHPLTDAEVDDIMREMAAKRASRPKKIHYPIETTITEGEGTSLTGLNIEFRALYSTTRSQPGRSAPILDKDGAVKYLTDAATALYRRAVDIERNAHPPVGAASNLGKEWGQQHIPGQMTLVVGSASAYVALPANAVHEPIPKDDQYRYLVGQQPARAEDQIRDLVKRAVDSAWEMQLSQLGEPKGRPSDLVPPPPGYSLTLRGRRENTGAASPIFLLPISKDKVRLRLVAAIRNAISRDQAPLDLGTADMRAADSKLRIPEYSEATIQGPQGSATYRIPTAPSKAYPNAAEVSRGADQAIEQAAEKASQQVAGLRPGRPLTSGGAHV